jgi:integrase/recombinase XerD
MSKIDSENKTGSNVIFFNFKGGSMIETRFGKLTTREAIRAAMTPKERPARKQRRGKRGKAKVFSREDIQKLLSFVRTRRASPEADIVKILLSFQAGLRACEISGLRISDVSNPDGSTGDIIQIRAGVTKGGRGREIPMHPDLKNAIDAFRLRYPESEWLAVSNRYQTVKHQKPNAISVWFWLLYKQCGFQGCSSHSGRRTFITTLARNLGRTHSLRDIQQIVGHRLLNTTQSYIDCSPNQRELVSKTSELFEDVEEDA